jgi:hypothetical protein
MKGIMKMTIVKNTTKKAQNMIDRYNWYTNRYGLIDIHQAYKTPSVYKVRAWRDIAAMCERMNGHGLTVLGHNCMKYSAAFKAVEDGIEKLFYFTADYDYEIALS